MHALLALSAMVWLFLGCSGKDAAPIHSPVEQQAKALEQRLLAPCCWRETLDVHVSPLATELRAEIRSRIAQGQASGPIEADLVARYGARIQARFAESLGVWVVALIGAAGGLLLYLVRRRGASEPPRDSPSGTPAGAAQEARKDSADRDYEEQLDQDLLD